MDADQFQQYMAAQAHASKKVPAFSSGLGNDWIAWKRTFANICELKGWNAAGDANVARKKSELKAAMEGAAVRQVADIDADGKTFQQLLDAYEARFLPAASQRYARAAFKQARQQEGELILAYHTRIRELYSQAHPNKAAADIETEAELIESFVLGLYHHTVRERTLDSLPQNMTDALATATQKEATLKQLGSMNRRQGLYSMGTDASGPPGACWGCGQIGHLKRDCPSKKKSGKGGGSFRGRNRWGNRGGGNSRGGGGQVGAVRAPDQAALNPATINALNVAIERINNEVVSAALESGQQGN